MTFTQRQLTELLIPLIDQSRDPILQAEDTVTWAQAAVTLHTLISNPETWDMIFAVSEDCESNHVLHALGAKRIEWLKLFKERN
jgi:hypothetical protein